MVDTITLLFEHFIRCRLISTDSRSILPGSIFFALRGERFNGNAYAAGALDAGAAYAVVDDADYYLTEDSRYIWVEDVLVMLQALARQYRRTFSIPILGITGSNGKTTTKELIYAALATEKTTHATQGNLNNHIGVPLTLLRMPPETDIGIIEMGANQPGDIQQLCEIAEPTLGLITNIGKAHLERLKSLEGVMETKGALYRSVQASGGEIFVNEADHRVVSLAEGKKVALSYGTTSSDIYGSITSQQISGMRVSLTHTGWKTPFEIECALSGVYNLLNIQAAVAVAASLGISLEGIQKGISSYIPSNNRSQVVEKWGTKIWLDAYNANPTSMQAAIDHIFQLNYQKVVLVLGDMYEVGEKAKEAHENLAKQINRYQPTITIGIGPLMKHMVAHIKGNSLWFSSLEEGSEQIHRHMRNAEITLIKGSRGMALENLLNESTA